MAETKDSDKDQELKAMEQAVKDKFYRESVDEPLSWVKLDSAILDDTDLQDLRDGYGKDYCWDFIALATILAKRKGHSIDIRNDNKWLRLSNQLEQYDVTATKEFISVLLHYELIDKSAFEHGLIINDRIMRTAQDYAKQSAHGKFMVWKRERNKQGE